MWSVGDKVRVSGKGNRIYVIAEKSSPIRDSDFVVIKANGGGLLSVHSSRLKKVNR